MTEGTGPRRKLEVKIENGHVKIGANYKRIRDLIRDILILASLIGFGHNTLTLNEVKAQLAECQRELHSSMKMQQQEQIPEPLPGESFSDYMHRVSKGHN